MDKVTNLHHRVGNEFVEFRYCYDIEDDNTGNDNANVPPCPTTTTMKAKTTEYSTDTDEDDVIQLPLTSQQQQSSASSHFTLESNNVFIWFNKTSRTTTSTIVVSEIVNPTTTLFDSISVKSISLNNNTSSYKTTKKTIILTDNNVDNNKREDNKSKFQIQIKVCNDAFWNTKCPIDCTSPAEKYPKLWDDTDRVCKSTDPRLKYGGKCTCRQACSTPAANFQNSSWPWSSWEERSAFLSEDDNGQYDANYNTRIQKLKRQRKQQRNKHMKQQQQQQQQQQQYINESQQLEINDIDENDDGYYSDDMYEYKIRFDDYCSHQREQQQQQQQHLIDNNNNNNNNTINNHKLSLQTFAQFKHHFMYYPKGKLMFCGIPKVGMTEWIKFLRYTIGAGDYLSMPHYKLDRMDFMVSSLSIEKASQLLDNPEWTKAVLFRNPAERLLSAYLDKVVGEGYTHRVFHIGDGDITLSFEEFVDLVTAEVNVTGIDICKDLRDQNLTGKGLHRCTNPHWMPQVLLCGLDTILPKFDFIGHFEYISEHTKLLLERVNLWDSHGKHFDDGKGGTVGGKCSARPATFQNDHQKDDSTMPLGFNQRGVTHNSSNRTHSTSSKAKMEEYYTPQLLDKVRKAYAIDYVIWDELERRMNEGQNVGGVPAGKDLEIVKSYCSKEYY
jgi:hypothetical protein